MRDWILKWQKSVIWVIAIVFVVGIVWWSVASYIGMNQAPPETNGSAQGTPSRTEAAVVLTKEGTDLSYDYWVFPYELSDSLQQELMSYRQQNGQEIDELFQEPVFELQVAKNLADSKIILYYADQQGITPSAQTVAQRVDELIGTRLEDASYKSAVISQFGTVEAFKEYLSRPIKIELTNQLVRDSVAKPTMQQMEEYFNENKETLQKENEQVKAAHILVETREEANDILAQIQAGTLSFDDAASSFSLDESNKGSGGDLGWFKRDQMVPEFEQAAFNAPVGELVGPVQTEFGYHLIRVDEKQVFDTFQDFLDQVDLYQQTATTLQASLFRDWLDAYKQDEGFAYQLNDDVLRIFDRYLDALESGEEKSQMVAFQEYLEPFILVEQDGETLFAEDVDPRIIALYLNVVEGLDQNRADEIETLTTYQELGPQVSDQMKALSLDQISTAIEQIQASIDALPETGEETALQNLRQEKENYQQAKTWRESKQLIDADPELSPTNLQGQIEDREQTMENNQDLLKKGYHLLYDMNTSSPYVVQRLFQLDPGDKEVALRYYQGQIDSYLVYLRDAQYGEIYRTILQPQMDQIRQGLLGIARDETQEKALRVSAYEVVLQMLESLEDYESELVFLKELRELDPGYSDIDQIIAQIEQAVEEARALENATATTQDGTQTANP
ncbi:MAG TPA: peptidylprolyl isomerase [Thermotogota bacterium]|nr:peptidylprolyl isomerase [Thermotogota bacterium]HRW91854.1 peptidylprolyl isomerase [Thermotogota bacterium]